jgi:hypothetical protein
MTTFMGPTIPGGSGKMHDVAKARSVEERLEEE